MRELVISFRGKKKCNINDKKTRKIIPKKPISYISKCSNLSFKNIFAKINPEKNTANISKIRTIKISIIKNIFTIFHKRILKIYHFI